MFVLSTGFYLVMPAIILAGASIYYISEAADAIRVDRKASVRGRIASALFCMVAAVAWMALLIRDVISAIHF